MGAVLKKRSDGGMGLETAWALFWGAALAAVLVSIPLGRMRAAARQNRFDTWILAAAGENGCDPNLVKALVWRESKFDPSIRGRDGELGLMQVKPAVAGEWTAARGQEPIAPAALLDPRTNLRVGSWYLARALQHWAQASEPVPLALAQYNAGRTPVLKWVDADSLADMDAFLGRIQYPSTRSYVRDIMKQYRRYRQRGEF